MQGYTYFSYFFAPKHRLWVLVRSSSVYPSKNKKNSKIFQFLQLEKNVFITWDVFSYSRCATSTYHETRSIIFVTLFWGRNQIIMGKPTLCIGENKGADLHRSNCEADQRICFRYSDSTIPPLLNSKISSF